MLHGTYSLSSLFDHRYPLEFIHYDGVTISGFNDQTTIGVDGHQGYDFDMPEGTPIYAAYDGTVYFAGEQDPFYCPPLSATTTGNLVIIKHRIEDEEFASLYAHFSSILVSQGQIITKGTLLGYSGNTGCSTGPHLHFDIQRITNTNGNAWASIDPFGWNSTSADPWESHEKGTASFSLWAIGEAPEFERFFSVNPNPNSGDSAPIAITHVQWSGAVDSLIPNEEYVELTLDTRFSSGNTYNLSGMKLSNNAGKSYKFPSGARINSGKTIKLYSGYGTNSGTKYYWNQPGGIWDNKGDCIRLYYPNGSLMYYLYFAEGACSSVNAQGKTSGVQIKNIQDMNIYNQYLSSSPEL